MAQCHQTAQFADQRIGLCRQQIVHAAGGGGKHGGVADAPAFGGSQKHGGSTWSHTAFGVGPVAGFPVTEPQCLDHRNVQCEEIPAARLTVTQVSEVDQDIHLPVAEDVAQTFRTGGVEPEYDWQQTGGFAAGDQGIHFAGEHVGDHAPVNQERHPAFGPALPLCAMPAEIVVNVLENTGRARVVEAVAGQGFGGLEQMRWGGGGALHRFGQSKETTEVVLASGGVQGAQDAAVAGL